MIGLDRRARIEELAQLLEDDTRAHQARREIRQLVQLAAQVRAEVEPPVLPAASREAIRERVLAEIYAPTPAPTRARPVRSTRVAIASGVAALMVGTTGVAVASQAALPGDALYGIKKATESVRLALAGDSAETGRVELALARERLAEVTEGAARVHPDDLVATLREMDRLSLSGADNLLREAERSADAELLAEVLTFTEEQAAGIVAVFDDLPPQVRPYAEDSLATLRHIRMEMLAPVIAACDCAAELEAALDDCLVCANAAELLEQLSTAASLPAAPSPDRATDDGATGTGGTTGDDGGTTAGPSTGEVTDGARRVVPELPGPLDTLGRNVDDAVGSVTDTTGGIVDDTTGTVGGVVEGTGDAVDDLLDDPIGNVGGAVNDTLGNVGGAVDDVTGQVGGAIDDTLGGLRPGR